MKKAFDQYERLARGTFGCSSVWLGPDHLLYVKGNGVFLPFGEEYKRFRYRDIQGTVLARTSWLWVGAFFYGLSLSVFGGVCALMLLNRDPGESGTLIATLLFPFPVALLSLILFVRQLIVGPRCVCEIQTRLKCERLRPLNHLHGARRAMERLAERIAEAQSGLAVAAGYADLAAAAGEAEARRPGVRVPVSGLIAFGVMALAGLLGAALLHVESAALALAAILCLMVGVAPLLAGLAGAVRHRSPDSVRGLLWAQLAVAIVLFGGGVVYYFAMAIDDPALTLGLDGPVTAMARAGSLGGLPFYLFFLFFSLASAAIGAAGLLLGLRWRRTAKP